MTWHGGSDASVAEHSGVDIRMNPILGILCGMADEARVLADWRHDPRIVVRISAGRSVLARAHVREMCDLGVRGLLSWGVCGGLDPALHPGDVVECGPNHVLAADNIVSSKAEKARAFEAGYRIVDLESGAVADAAVPGWAVRAVLDEAGFDLPPPALVALRADGRPDLPRILWRLLLSPASLPAMIGLSHRHKAALTALSAQIDLIEAYLAILSSPFNDRKM